MGERHVSRREAVEEYSAGKVGAIQDQIAEVFPDVRGGDVELRDCVAAVTAMRLLGTVVERNLAAGGPEQARAVLTSFLHDFARNLSENSDGTPRAHAVKIMVDWRGGTA